MSTPKKISITIVVNGQPTVVDVFDDAPLGTIIPDALQQTEKSGQPPKNWELRDADGNLLDLDKKIGDYGFSDKVHLFLNLKAKGNQPISTPKKISITIVRQRPTNCGRCLR